MTMPGLTAEAAIGKSTTNYSGAGAHRATGYGREVRAALIAPTFCKTSSCLTVGTCRTQVRCCRSFTGACTCQTVPCFFTA